MKNRSTPRIGRGCRSAAKVFGKTVVTRDAPFCRVLLIAGQHVRCRWSAIDGDKRPAPIAGFRRIELLDVNVLFGLAVGDLFALDGPSKGIVVWSRALRLGEDALFHFVRL